VVVAGFGAIISISLPPQLTITPAGGNFVLTWLTNFTGFTLQSTSNLAPTIVWTTNSAATVDVNGQNVVANTFSGSQQFCRLAE
jgi:hypothetical protein